MKLGGFFLSFRKCRVRYLHSQAMSGHAGFADHEFEVDHLLCHSNLFALEIPMNPFCRTTLALPMPTMRWRLPRWPLIARGGLARRHGISRRLGCAALASGISLFSPMALALDVNVASAEQLEGLRGLGPRTAQLIVSERERGGRFESLEDLSDRVRGIGVKKAQALQAAGMTVGGAGSMSGTPTATSSKPGVAPVSATAPKATGKASVSGTGAASGGRSGSVPPPGRGAVPASRTP